LKRCSACKSSKLIRPPEGRRGDVDDPAGRALLEQLQGWSRSLPRKL
jgi:hypothetical protein